ncbi:MAG: hypothetical protein ABEN55_08590 [Bradymonadaceae bacterium]
MPDIPDLNELSPDRWLSKMQEVREELLAEFVRVLGDCHEPEAAVDAFTEVFDSYALPDDGETSEPLLSVRAEEEVLVFERESTGDERGLQRTDGCWESVDGETAIEAETDEEAHRELATEVLELLPWWSQGAFAQKVGRPEEFVDPSED